MIVATPLWPSVGVKPNTWKSWRFGALRDSRMFRARQQGPNTSYWDVLGVIGKVLKLRYRKWPRVGHSDICSPSYGQKKGQESNWQFDSRPLKVGNWPLPDVALKNVTRSWKALDESYNFGLGLVPIWVWGKELWPSKVPGLQPGTVLGLHFGTPNKMCHSDVASAMRRREYYMGEGGGFPRVRGVVCLVVQSARGLSQHPRVSRNVN